MDLSVIGSRIKVARERKHFTQEDLAAIVDLSPTHISVIERGVKPPKLATLVAIANALDVSADTLLQDVVERSEEGVFNGCNFVASRLQPGRPGSPENGTTDSTAHGQVGVGSVDNSIHLHSGYVLSDDCKGHDFTFLNP